MKKLLLSLFGIITLGLVNFGSCANFSDFITYLDSNTITVDAGSFYTVKEITSSDDYGTYCLKIKSFQGSLNGFFGMNSNLYSPNYNWMFEMFNDWGYPLYVCSYINVRYLVLYARDVPFTVEYDLFKLNTFLDTQVPVMTSLECQQNYSLIPISEITTNYCQLNGLCPSVPSEDSSGGISNFYVFSEGRYNQLSGTLNYFVNIPDYLNYSYDYSNNGDDLDLDIGLNYDTGYMEGVINNQTYIPTTDDLTSVFSNLGSFGVLLVVCLFVILVFYMFKKIFS